MPRVYKLNFHFAKTRDITNFGMYLRLLPNGVFLFYLFQFRKKTKENKRKESKTVPRRIESETYNTGPELR